MTVTPVTSTTAVAEPHIQLIGWTEFRPPADMGWRSDADGGQALAEFAGRACYQSWDKLRPSTATNAGYLAHILDVGHFSVLEHGTATFYLTGVSRSFTHELVRHRHLSFSQLSQRYVADAGLVVEPAAIAADPYLHRVFTDAIDAAAAAYRELAHGLERTITVDDEHRQVWVVDGARESGGESGTGMCVKCVKPWPCPAGTAARTAARKKARQAARAVLPNATETRIVVTGNYRAWRHFIDLRATEAADVEIRAIAVGVLRLLAELAPNVFGDYRIVKHDDGSESATTVHAERS